MEAFLALGSSLALKAAIAIATSAILILSYLTLRRKSPKIADGLALCLPMLLMFWAVMRYAPEAPFFDDFSAILGYLSKPERWRHLLDFHNEHRILVPRLFFDADWLILGKFSFRFCMVCGDVLLCAYVFSCWMHFRKTIGSVWMLPFAWLLLDICNYENTMWALCAVQNQGVILFAFLSIVFYAKRTDPRMLVASLVFAVLATLTSGSGLGVWPALLLMELGLSNATGCSYRDRHNAVRLGTMLGISALAIFLYFIGFGQRPPGPPLKPFSVLSALDFGFSFLGAVVPVHFVALPLGIIVAIPVVYILVTYRRRLKEPMFYFFLFLLSVVAAGVLTRSRLFDPIAAIHLRYRIVTFSLMLSTVWLLVRQLSNSLSTPHILSRAPTLFLALAILANLSELIVCGQLVSLRRERIEASISAYPDFKNCIDITNPEEAKTNLDAAAEAGVIECTWCVSP